MSLKPPKIILASTSPRRAEILKLLEIPFEIYPPLYEEESLADLSAYDEALHFSVEKARSLVHSHPDAIVIGSDTLLEFEGEKIGKPKNLAHAKEILNKLKGKSHDILTGVCLLNTQTHEVQSSVELIQVQMNHYCESEIETYITLDQPLDKAGAYALQGQGRFLIKSLSGDYLAAVGLPLRWIAQELSRIGYTSLASIEKIYQSRNFLNWKSY